LNYFQVLFFKDEGRYVFFDDKNHKENTMNMRLFHFSQKTIITKKNTSKPS